MKWFVRGHVIICGLNSGALVLARDFYERGYRIVAIDNGLSKGKMEKCRDLAAIILAGSGSDPEMLIKAQVSTSWPVP